MSLPSVPLSPCWFPQLRITILSLWGGIVMVLSGCDAPTTDYAPGARLALPSTSADRPASFASLSLDPQGNPAVQNGPAAAIEVPKIELTDTPTHQVRMVFVPQPLEGIRLVSFSEDDETDEPSEKEGEGESSDEDTDKEDADSTSKKSKFDEEIDFSEFDLSEDEAMEESASDWENAELVPTPVPQKEIVAEIVPAPLGIPENRQRSRKAPIFQRPLNSIPVAPVRSIAAGEKKNESPNASAPKIASAPTPNPNPLKVEGPKLASDPSDGSSMDVSINQVKNPGRVEPLQSVGVMTGPVDFKSWPMPAVTLFVTGQQHGYIEPCGCTGLANQKGGVARRMSFVKQLKQDGWELMPVDAGNLIRRFGRQAEIKFHRSLEALREMGYIAVGFGPDDVRIGVGDLIQEAAPEKPSDAVYASANVILFDPSLMPAYHAIEKGGVKVGVTSILDPDSLEIKLADEITLNAPIDSAKKVLNDLQAEQTQFNVLTFYGKEENAIELAQQVPGFDVIVVAGGYGEPTYQPQKVDGSDTQIILTGNKGMYAGLVGIYPDQSYKYARVPLTDEFEDAPEMRKLMADYQFQLRDLGFENLALKPIPHPSGEKFVGSEACGKCHTTAYDIWQNSMHFEATEHLVHPGERGDVPRHFDPECLSCHVTGWNPQNYYPYASGYLDLEGSKHLHGNGCENCHGPGESHAKAENGELEVSEERLIELRKSMQLPLENAREQCMQCHDLDNSPDFHEEDAFDDYWAEIEHYGVD